MKRLKICLAASSGGHFEQLLMLKPLLKEYDGFFLTERTTYKAQVKGAKMKYVLQVNREEKFCWFKLLANAFLSLGIYIFERPNVIVCTGVLAMIPMCMLVKLFGGKVIYIESFAKITSPTKTGKLIYKFADKFYVQWESMKVFYPKAECLGGIY